MLGFYLRNVDWVFRLLDVEPSPEGAISNGGHGSRHVLGVSVREAVLGGLLQGRDGGRLVDVLLAAGSPMEESGILKDTGIAVADLESDLVRKNTFVV
jgi:hypothetical protein